MQKAATEILCAWCFKTAKKEKENGVLAQEAPRRYITVTRLRLATNRG